jgi:hypothetical protein
MGRQPGKGDNGITKTVKTYDKFTKLTGWGAADIRALDHVLVSVNVDGEGILPGNSSQYPHRNRYPLGESLLNINERHYYVITGTLKAADMPMALRRIKATVETDSAKVNLRVKYMTTRNVFGDTLKWELYRGEMVLIEVNGEMYTSLTEKDLVIAADEMFFDGCEVKRNEVVTGFVCGIGENGEKIRIKTKGKKKSRKVTKGRRRK